MKANLTGKITKEDTYHFLDNYLDNLYKQEKEFEKIHLKRREKMKLYFPPDAFHIYTELFRKLI